MKLYSFLMFVWKTMACSIYQNTVGPINTGLGVCNAHTYTAQMEARSSEKYGKRWKKSEKYNNKLR